jgi:transcriptional regulator with XRE-family HTH domain
MAVEETKANDFTTKYREISRSYIMEVMRANNWTQAQLAKKVKVAPSTFTRTIQAQHHNTIKPATLFKVAQVSNMPIPKELLGWVQEDEQKPEIAHVEAEMPNKPVELFGTDRGVPLYSLLPSEVSSGLYKLLRRGTTDRPHILAGIEEARALIVPDNSMKPVFVINHIVETDPSRLPGPDDDVVVEIDTGEVMIRRFVDMDKDKLTLACFSPMYALTHIERSKVRSMETIVFVIRH